MTVNHAFHTLSVELYRKQQILTQKVSALSEASILADVARRDVAELEKALRDLGYDLVKAIDYGAAEFL